MKKITLLSFLVLITWLVPSLSVAQTQFEINRSIRLNEGSDQESIKINVQKNTSRLLIIIKSNINQGKLLIEIYDPNGEKQGNFTIESQIISGEGKKESVDGSISKTINQPITGNWYIKLTPTKANSIIKVRIRQNYQDNK